MNGILGSLFMDIAVPVALIYMYMSNMVATGFLKSSSGSIDVMTGNISTNGIDPMHMK